MKRYFIYIFLVMALSFSAQTAPETIKIKKADEPVILAEVQPEYPGGFVAMGKFISKNIQFPDSIDNAMCVTVFTSFVINTDGSISDAKIVRCRPECAGCCEETLRVIKSMPNWKPGTTKGKPVAVTYTIPIRFALK